MDILYKIFIFYIPLLFSLCVHEYSHAWVAKKLGDCFAEMQGRLTLNPLVHMDVVGTLILPMLALFTGLPVFGWAKPVPVDESALKEPVKDMFWIALAGPLSNFLMAALGGLLIVFLYIDPTYSLSSSVGVILQTFIFINLLLGFFNLIPLHPLDGGKVLARFLKPKWSQFLEERQGYSSFLLILIFVMGGFHYLAYPAIILTNILTEWPRLVF